MSGGDKSGEDWCEYDDDFEHPADAQDDDVGEDAWLAGIEEGSDFPDEEEDEDNPDWYRHPEPEEVESLEERHCSVSDLDGLPFSEDPSASINQLRSSRSAVVPEESNIGAVTRRVPSIIVHYDDEGYFGYVLIKRPTGEEATRSDVRLVRSALEEADLRVVRSGPSQRPANDGEMYDWYLRVQRPRGGKPAAAVVERAVAHFAPPQNPLRPAVLDRGAKAVASGIAALQARLSLREKEIYSLREANRLQLRELAIARKDSEAARQEIRTVEDEYVERLKTLRYSLSQTRNDADGERQRADLLQSELARSVAEAQSRFEAGQREHHEFIQTFEPEIARRDAVIERLEDAVRCLENERDMLTFDRDQSLDRSAALGEELLKVRDDRVRRTGGLDVDEVFSTLLPMIHLLPGSTQEVGIELTDKGPVLERLAELASRGACRGQKAVRGADGWWEIHYSTGQKDNGRLYFAQRDAGGFWVLISRKTSKGEQRRDIDRLRKHEL